MARAAFNSLGIDSLGILVTLTHLYPVKLLEKGAKMEAQMRKFFKDLKSKVDPAHTALVVVDVQYDFCAVDGAYAQMGLDTSMMRQMIPRLSRFIEFARGVEIPIIFTRGMLGSGQNESDAWLELINRRTDSGHHSLCVAGTRGVEFFPPIEPLETDPVITKHRYSAFVGTNLDQILRSNNIQTVIATGVVTHVCVEAFVRSACDLDYRVVVLEDCTATISDEIQREAINRMATLFADRATSEDIIEFWGITVPG